MRKEMMAMSLYSTIGIALMIVSLIVGTIIKLVLRKQREDLDGCHGFVHKVEIDTDDTGWETIE